MSDDAEDLLRAELRMANELAGRRLERIRELEAQVAAHAPLVAVAEAIVAQVVPPLPPEAPLVVRLAWVGGLAEGREG